MPLIIWRDSAGAETRADVAVSTGFMKAALAHATCQIRMQDALASLALKVPQP